MGLARTTARLVNLPSISAIRGKSVVLAAADTFRAAAGEQLKYGQTEPKCV